MRPSDGWSPLAGMSTAAMLGVAFALVMARLALYAYRKQLGAKERGWGELAESLLFAWVVVFLIVRPFVFELFKIPSASMRKTLMEGDRIAVTKYPYRFRPPRRGEVIVFKSPPEAGSREVDFVKRLIGLPGEEIRIWHGQVYVNGVPIHEPYLYEPIEAFGLGTDTNASGFAMTVPPGHVLAMGDNRRDSKDSRSWGPLEMSRIKGNVAAILWPPSRIRLLRAPEYALPSPTPAGTQSPSPAAP